MNEKRPIFVIEDNDDDYELFARLLASVNPPVGVERAVSGNAAVRQFLLAKAESAPSIVFTDLAMPDGDGFEFLAWARGQPLFRDTVLVVLSSTRRGADIDKAYALGAHFFLSKFPTAAVLAALCAAAEKKDVAVQSRLAALRAQQTGMA